jgi:hypothetical protein
MSFGHVVVWTSAYMQFFLSGRSDITSSDHHQLYARFSVEYCWDNRQSNRQPIQNETAAWIRGVIYELATCFTNADSIYCVIVTCTALVLTTSAEPFSMKGTGMLSVFDIVLPWSFIIDTSQYNYSSDGLLTLSFPHYKNKDQTKSSKSRPASTVSFTGVLRIPLSPSWIWSSQ